MSALVGVRIVEWSRNFPAAMAAMHLADQGAEVVTIGRTDEQDRLVPGYLAWDRNKTRLHRDVDDASDRTELDRLLAYADVVVVDAPIDELVRVGLDGPALTTTHPRLVHAWAPPYGTRGEWHDAPFAHGLLTALTGVAHNQPSYADSPVHLVSPQASYAQANCLAIAVGAALLERSRSGQGQEVVVTGLDGVAQATATTRFGAPLLNIMGAPLGGAPNYRLYECADGEWLFLGALFEALYLQTLEVTDVLVDVLADPTVDGDLRAALVPPGSATTTRLLEGAFRSRPRAEWLERLQSAGIPSGPVGTREEWFASATTEANDMRVELEHPDLGTVCMPGISLRMSGTPARHPRLPTRTATTPLWAPDGAVSTAPSGTAAGDAPLAGVRVLDLGVVIAGAYAGAMLAGLGADVVKIETPSGDPFRSYGPTFSSYNRGKRSLVLDLKQPEARHLFLELVADADVVLDNYRLGVRERLGIAYHDLCAVNPRIISLTITGYGTEGPLVSLPGYDPLLQAQSGMMRAQGGPDDEPVFGFIAANDVGSAAMSVFGIVMALLARERTATGQEIRTSLAAQSVLLQIGELTTFPGAPAPLVGARDCIGVHAGERFYECVDGWVAIACRTPAQAVALLTALGLPDVDASAALSAPRDGDLAARIAAAFALWTAKQARVILGAAGVPIAPVLSIVDTLTDPYLRDNDFYEEYVDPGFGTGTAVQFFAEFSRSPTGFPRPAPALGQHSAEVLAEFGLSAERIGELFARRRVT